MVLKFSMKVKCFNVDNYLMSEKNIYTQIIVITSLAANCCKIAIHWIVTFSTFVLRKVGPLVAYVVDL